MLQVEVTGTVIQFEDDEAALVVYCHETANGQHVTLLDESSASSRGYGYMDSDTEYNFVLECAGFGHLEAPIIARSVGGKTNYAAIFPRLKLFKERGKQKGLTRRTPALWAVTFEGDTIDINDKHSERVAFPILYAGNVTEVDWTQVIWNRETWNRHQEQKEHERFIVESEQRIRQRQMERERNNQSTTGATNTLTIDGATFTVSRVERNADEIVYYLEINHPGVTDGVEVLPLAHHISNSSTSSYQGIAASFSDAAIPSGKWQASSTSDEKSRFSVKKGSKFYIKH